MNLSGFFYINSDSNFPGRLSLWPCFSFSSLIWRLSASWRKKKKKKKDLKQVQWNNHTKYNCSFWNPNIVGLKYTALISLTGLKTSSQSVPLLSSPAGHHYDTVIFAALTLTVCTSFCSPILKSNVGAQGRKKQAFFFFFCN